MSYIRYLPRGEILSLLIELIGATEGVVQQAAVKALIDAASSASGKNVPFYESVQKSSQGRE